MPTDGPSPAEEIALALLIARDRIDALIERGYLPGCAVGWAWHWPAYHADPALDVIVTVITSQN